MRCYDTFSKIIQKESGKTPCLIPLERWESDSGTHHSTKLSSERNKVCHIVEKSSFTWIEVVWSELEGDTIRSFETLHGLHVPRIVDLMKLSETKTHPLLSLVIGLQTGLKYIANVFGSSQMVFSSKTLHRSPARVSSANDSSVPRFSALFWRSC